MSTPEAVINLRPSGGGVNPAREPAPPNPSLAGSVVRSKEVVPRERYHLGRAALACRCLGQRTDLNDENGETPDINSRRPLPDIPIGVEPEMLRRQVHHDQVGGRLAVVACIRCGLLHALRHVGLSVAVTVVQLRLAHERVLAVEVGDDVALARRRARLAKPRSTDELCG